MESIEHIMNTLLETFSVRSLITACVVGGVGYLILKAVLHFLKKLLQKSNLTEQQQQQVFKIARVVLIVLIVIAVGAELGVDTSAFVALLSVLMLGCVLAAETILANMAGGIVLNYTKPFAKGDIVTIGQTTGYVEEISINCTKIWTFDGALVTIPNKEVSMATVVNTSAKNQRRIILSINVSYDDEPAKVKEVCSKVLLSVNGILQDPAPRVHLAQYGSSNLVYDVIFYVRPNQYLTKKYEVTEKLYDALVAAGLTISYDHLNVHMM